MKNISYKLIKMCHHGSYSDKMHITEKQTNEYSYQTIIDLQ